LRLQTSGAERLSPPATGHILKWDHPGEFDCSRHGPTPAISERTAWSQCPARPDGSRPRDVPWPTGPGGHRPRLRPRRPSDCHSRLCLILSHQRRRQTPGLYPTGDRRDQDALGRIARDFGIASGQSMSNEPKLSPLDPIPKITEFFLEREANDECPVCKNPTWTLLDSPEASTSLPVKGRIPTFGLRGHDLYSFVCRKCGYLRSHLRAVVDREVDLLELTAVREPVPRQSDETRAIIVSVANLPSFLFPAPLF
jgi:hypothetical protein